MLVHSFGIKKSSCQLLMAKECTLSTGKLPLGSLCDHPNMFSAVYRESDIKQQIKSCRKMFCTCRKQVFMTRLKMYIKLLMMKIDRAK